MLSFFFPLEDYRALLDTPPLRRSQHPRALCLFVSCNDMFPFLFLPSVHLIKVEVSKYLITMSFWLELHTIVVSKDVASPLGVVIGYAHIWPIKMSLVTTSKYVIWVDIMWLVFVNLLCVWHLDYLILVVFRANPYVDLCIHNPTWSALELGRPLFAK